MRASLWHQKLCGTAARSETQRVARGEDTDSESASLNLPEQPLAAMNLPPLRGSHESLVRQNERAEKVDAAAV